MNTGKIIGLILIAVGSLVGVVGVMIGAVGTLFVVTTYVGGQTQTMGGLLLGIAIAILPAVPFAAVGIPILMIGVGIFVFCRARLTR